MLQAVGKQRLSQSTMMRIATYVFLDLETTGLPVEELNRTKITELSMVAVKRSHLLDYSRPSPRVQHKLTLCFNPRRYVSDQSSKITGLCNFLLENEPAFDKNTFNVINSFLDLLEKPVCLVAYNGLAFDFPILKNHLEKLKVNFDEHLFCTDSFHAFYDIEQKLSESKGVDQSDFIAVSSLTPPLSNLKSVPIEASSKTPPQTGTNSAGDIQSPSQNVAPSTTTEFNEDVDLIYNRSMQEANERTPKRRKAESRVNSSTKVRRIFQKKPWGDGESPKKSYKLMDIYERTLKKPANDGHRAENDCIFMLEIAASRSKDFVEWVDRNCVEYSEVVPMALGVQL